MDVKNPALYLIKILVLEAKDLLVFPLWWYTGGFLGLLGGLKEFLSDSERSLAFFVWVKNIFVPMYGQSDWQGKIISLFIRVIQIIFRGFALLVMAIFALAIAAIWLILPLLIIYQVLFQLKVLDINLSF